MERCLVKMRIFAIRGYKSGWTGDEIARELQKPRSTVYDWLHKEEIYNKNPGRSKMPVDKKTRKEVIRLKKKGKPTSEADLMIASVAKVNNLILVTRDKKHFENIDIKIEVW